MIHILNFDQAQSSTSAYGPMHFAALGTKPGMEFLLPNVPVVEYPKDTYSLHVNSQDNPQFKQPWGQVDWNTLFNKQGINMSAYDGYQEVDFYQVDQSLFDLLLTLVNSDSKLSKNVPFRQFANYHNIQEKDFGKATISRDFVTGALFLKTPQVEALNFPVSSDGNIYFPLIDFLLTQYGKRQPRPEVKARKSKDSGSIKYVFTDLKMDSGSAKSLIKVFVTRFAVK